MNIPVKKIGSAVLALVLLTITWACAVNPVTGKKEIMFISEKMEISMGESIDRGLKQEYGIYDDPQLNAYVAEVGQQLVPYTHRPHLKYHFAVLDTPVENAFAAPGGYIYITRGLLALMNSEAEMATVLGHELGHVAARHSARQMTRSILVNVGLLLAGELSEDFKKIAPVSVIASQLLFLRYSRVNEYQADALGIEYSMKSGYSGNEMIDFFGSLERLSESRGGGHLPNFLSTHPMTPRRVQKVRDLLAAGTFLPPGGESELTVERDGYLTKLNGLVVGKNPRHGYVENNTFYHPGMGFSFRVPRGWEVVDTPLQVSLTPPGGKAAVVFKAEEASDPLPEYSQKMMKNLTSPRVLSREHRSVNGLDAFHTLASVRDNPQDDDGNGENRNRRDINVDISCIRKEGHVFTFFSIAGESDWSTYRYNIDDMKHSFRRLNDPEHLRRRPRRLAVRRVRGAVTLSEFLRNQRVPQAQWETIALLNGLQPDSQLSPRQLVKILR